jgi:hypothetical protein
VGIETIGESNDNLANDEEGDGAWVSCGDGSGGWCCGGGWVDDTVVGSRGVGIGGGGIGVGVGCVLVFKFGFGWASAGILGVYQYMIDTL